MSHMNGAFLFSPFFFFFLWSMAGRCEGLVVFGGFRMSIWRSGKAITEVDDAI